MIRDRRRHARPVWNHLIASLCWIVLIAGGAGFANAQCAACAKAAGSAECAACKAGLMGRLAGHQCASCEAKTGDGSHCGMPAPSYPVPFATPSNVTHTNFTYPPLMPHHSLPNYSGTYAFRHGPGTSRTTVMWRAPTLISAGQYLHHLFEIPR